MRTRTRSSIVLLLAMTLLAPSSHALAAGAHPGKAKPAATAKAVKGEAKKHLDAGTKLFRAGDYAGARRELEQAQKLAPRSATLRMLAESSFKLNEYATAYAEYEELSRAPGASKAEVADAQRMMKTLDLLTGQIEIADNGATVEVFVDDKSIGKTPFDKPIRIAMGVHKVRATMDGADVYTADIAVKPQETVPVPIDAMPKTIGTDANAAAVTAKTGKVSIHVTPPEATILIDGDERATGEFDGELPLGSHHVSLIYIGFKNESRDIEVTEGEPAAVDVKLEPEGDAPKAAGGASTGLYASAALFGAIPAVGATIVPAEPGATGASSFQLGAGLALHGGYSFGLLGLEGTLAFLGDRHTEQHGIPGNADPETQDFQNGNSARTESFLIYSLGGFAGAGPRVTTQGQTFRVSASISPGVSVRRFSLQRTTGIAGIRDPFAASTTQANFAVTGDLSLLIGSTPGFKVMVGLFAWLEVAGNTSTPSGDPHVVTVPSGDHTVDALVPTPPYPVQSGPQIFIGPQLGIRFGQ